MVLRLLYRSRRIYRSLAPTHSRNRCQSHPCQTAKELSLLTFTLQLYIGRDLNQDPLAHSLRGLRRDFGIPTRDENGNKPLAAKDHKLLVSACQEEYAKLLGQTYHACYPPMMDSGGKFTGCQHSKFGMLVMDSFLRVSRRLSSVVCRRSSSIASLRYSSQAAISCL